MATRQRSYDRPVTVCAESLRRALIGEVLDLIEPELPELTAAEKRALRNGDLSDVVASRRAAILEWRRHVARLPDWYVSKYSFGLDLKRKVYESEAKLALPETLRVHVDGEVRALSDAALLELLAGLGIVTQNRDSASCIDMARPCGALPELGTGETPPVGVDLAGAVPCAEQQASLRRGGSTC